MGQTHPPGYHAPGYPDGHRDPLLPVALQLLRLRASQHRLCAKSTGLHPRPVLEGIFYLYQNFVSIGGFFFLALPLALVLARANRPLFVNYLALNLAAYLFFGYRRRRLIGCLCSVFWCPLLPFTYLLVYAGLIQMRSNWSPCWASSIIVLLVLGQTGYLLATSLEQRFIAGVGSGLFRPDGGARVAYLQRQVHTGDTIAVIDAGIHAYMLPLADQLHRHYTAGE